MDNQIAFDALYNTMLAARILGESQAYQDSLAVAFKQLPPMQIGRHNQIQEWLIDADNPRDDHRHISHLLWFVSKQSDITAASSRAFPSC